MKPIDHIMNAVIIALIHMPNLKKLYGSKRK